MLVVDGVGAEVIDGAKALVVAAIGAEVIDGATALVVAAIGAAVVVSVKITNCAVQPLKPSLAPKQQVERVLAR